MLCGRSGIVGGRIDDPGRAQGARHAYHLVEISLALLQPTTDRMSGFSSRFRTYPLREKWVADVPPYYKSDVFNVWRLCTYPLLTKSVWSSRRPSLCQVNRPCVFSLRFSNQTIATNHLAGCAAVASLFGKANGSRSGVTRTPVVNLSGYLPPVGKVNSTK